MLHAIINSVLFYSCRTVRSTRVRKATVLNKSIGPVPRRLGCVFEASIDVFISAR